MLMLMLGNATLTNISSNRNALYYMVSTFPEQRLHCLYSYSILKSAHSIEYNFLLENMFWLQEQLQM